MLQTWNSSLGSASGQSVPPLAGAGSVQVRVLVEFPPPQAAEQPDQSDQSDQEPYTLRILVWRNLNTEGWGGSPPDPRVDC